MKQDKNNSLIPAYLLIIIGLLWGLAPYINFLITKHHFFNPNLNALSKDYVIQIILMFAKWQIPTLIGYLILRSLIKEINLFHKRAFKVIGFIFMSLFPILVSFTLMTFDIPLTEIDLLNLIFAINFLFFGLIFTLLTEN